MPVNTRMRITLYTLVDITESGIRRGPDKLAVGQQANYDTLIQVIGLRANPEPIFVKEHSDSISKIGFGTSFKATQTYWEFIFEMPEGSTNLDLLQDDFDLIPIVAGLNETVKFNVSVFKTRDPSERNIVFNCVDNN